MAEDTKQDGARSGLQQLIQTAGAGVALLVALTTASYTLYQKFIVDPADAKNATKKDFSDALGKFASTVQLEQSQLSFATNDQSKNSVLVNASYPLTAALVQAENDANTNGFSTTPAEFNQLASDEQAMSRWDQVVTFAGKSIAAGAKDFDAANAHDMIGKALLASKGPGSIKEGRDEMEKSQDSIRGVVSLGVNQSRAGFLMDWAYLEGMWGDCGAYKSIIGKIDVLSTQSDVNPDFKRAALSQPLMIQAAKRCAPESAPINSGEIAGSAQDKLLPSLVEEEKLREPAKPLDPDAKVVSVQDALGTNQNYEAITIYIRGQRVGRLHVEETNRAANASVAVKLGDAYRLEGYESTTENGERLRRTIRGNGHFHGHIFPVYHFSKGSKSNQTQTVILEKGPASANY